MDIFNTIIDKIHRGTVTCEDFNLLINHSIGESTPEAIRDRLRRRTLRNETDSHIEPESGHQQLSLPTMNDRIQPKRAPSHQQNHGRAKLAHAHSARKQTIDASLEFITKNYRIPLTENMLDTIQDKELTKSLATKLLLKSGVDSDWLHDLIKALNV